MPAISSVSGTIEHGGEVIDRDLLHVEQAIQQLTNKNGERNAEAR